MGAIAVSKWVAYGPERFNTAIMMSGGGMDVDKIMAVVSQYNNGSTDFTLDLDELKQKGIVLIDPDSDVYREAKNNAITGKKLPKIMMTVGGNDFIRSFVHISRDLYKGYGYDVTYEEVPNYTHEWDFWDMTLRKMLYEILPIRHDVILPENND